MVTSARLRWLLAAAILVAITYLVIHILTTVRQPHPSVETEMPVRSGADLSLEQLKFSEVRDGITRWEMVAVRADHDRGAGVTLLYGPVMTVPAAAGHGPIRLVSDEAEYDERTKNVRLRGNVLVTGDRGAEFRTGHADFISAASRVRTSDRISFRQPGLTVTGTGMELESDTRNIRVLSDVEAVVLPVSKTKAH